MPAHREPEELVTVAITARGSDALPLENAISVLVIDTWPEGGELTAAGYRPSFTIPRSKLGNGGDMTVRNEGYVTRKARIITPLPGSDQGIRVENTASKQQTTVEGAYEVMDQEFICQLAGTPEPPHPIDPIPTDLLPLFVDGKWFRTSDGAPFSQYGCSDFRALQRFIAGEDIEPLLSERAAIGFNQLRVFLMCDLMFHLYPQEHADYFDKLAAFMDRIGAHGLRAELTVLVDVTKVMPDLRQQQQFFSDVCARVSGRPHIFVELVNEIEQAINVTDPRAFTQPEGIIASHGSKGVVDAAAEAVCVTPLWSYGTAHPARPADWPRLIGHNTMEDVSDKFGVPGTCNESCRPDQGRGPIPSDWFDGAANAALLAAGATFHSQCGKDSRLFDPTERACADAWMAGARAVPLQYQRGQYIAGHLSGFPINWQPGDSSRAHGRLIGERACLSLPQMREGFVPVARPGWHIVSQDGSVVIVAGDREQVRMLNEEAVLDDQRREHARNRRPY